MDILADLYPALWVLALAVLAVTILGVADFCSKRSSASADQTPGEITPRTPMAVNPEPTSVFETWASDLWRSRNSWI